MATDTPPKPSFSKSRRWFIGFNVVFVAVVVLAIAVMINYLSSRYFHRYYLSTNTRVELSPRTISFLRSITNQIHVTLYYDKEEPFFNDIAELLKLYHSHDPRISVQTVDYNRDPAKAQEIKTQYKLASTSDRNLIIFDCEGRTKIVHGAALPEYTYQQTTNQPGLHFNHKLIGFNGEMLFTEALLTVTNPKPLEACYLEGHGEHGLNNDADDGYSKFMTNLLQNYVRVIPLTLLGTNTVPADSPLLIIAGPKDPIPQVELGRIDQYLNEGGRLWVMFNISSIGHPTGLEALLARWGIRVGNSTLKDPENTTGGSDVIVTNFTRHPIVNPLADSRLQLILPRQISRIDAPPQSSDGMKVEEIAFSGPHTLLQNQDAPQRPSALPLVVAVEKTATQAGSNHRATRILAVGDSIFLDNQLIDYAENRDFANNALNWLLERNVLMQGIGPRSVAEFRLLISRPQMHTLQWILLAAIPGGVLLFGGLVWMRRRK